MHVYNSLNTFLFAPIVGLFEPLMRFVWLCVCAFHFSLLHVISQLTTHNHIFLLSEFIRPFALNLYIYWKRSLYLKWQKSSTHTPEDCLCTSGHKNGTSEINQNVSISWGLSSELDCGFEFMVDIIGQSANSEHRESIPVLWRRSYKVKCIDIDFS